MMRDENKIYHIQVRDGDLSFRSDIGWALDGEHVPKMFCRALYPLENSMIRLVWHRERLSVLVKMEQTPLRMRIIEKAKLKTLELEDDIENTKEVQKKWLPSLDTDHY
jgi:hypothetical protein